MEGGTGISGANVALQNTSGRSALSETSGDGVFRIRDLAPGEYKVSITRPGFVGLQRDVQIRAGQVAVLEVVMTAVSLPPAAAELPPVTQSSPYREIVRPGSTAPADEPGPAGTLPGDEKVFVPAPDRWGYRFPPETRTRESHWYDPFDRNKLKGDYPILGNRTFLVLNFVSTTFADARQLDTPGNVPSARPAVPLSSASSASSS